MKKTITLLLIIIAILLTSCAQKQPYQEINYYKGTEGVKINFVESAPPTKVETGQIFPLMITLHNKGAWTIDEPYNAILSINYDPKYLEKANEQENDELKKIHLIGKSPYWPEGETRTITAELLRAKKLSQLKGVETSIEAIICYPYKTKLSTRVCIDPSTLEPIKEEAKQGVCRATTQTFTDQGAPIAITRIEPQNTIAAILTTKMKTNKSIKDENGKLKITSQETTEYVNVIKPQFRITIKNLGQGLVAGPINNNPDGSNSCQSSNYKPGLITIKAMLGNTELECTGSGQEKGQVKLINNEGTVTCKVKEKDLRQVKSSYYDYLTIELGYYYKEGESRKIEIINTGGYQEMPRTININCESYNNNKEQCLRQPLYYDCAWCEENNKCLSAASSGACKSCGKRTEYDPNTKTCEEPCPSNPLSAKIIGEHATNGDYKLILACDDKAVSPESKKRCGCTQLYFTISNDQVDCEAINLEPKTGTYPYGLSEVRYSKGISINDVNKWVCGYAKNQKGTRSNVVKGKIIDFFDEKTRKEIIKKIQEKNNNQ